MSEEQVVNNGKQSDFIDRTRQLAGSYADWIKTARARVSEWQALYNALIAEEDFTGQNLEIIANPTRLDSLTNVIANLEGIIATWDAGVRTNFERVSR